MNNSHGFSMRGQRVNVIVDILTPFQINTTPMASTPDLSGTFFATRKRMKIHLKKLLRKIRKTASLTRTGNVRKPLHKFRMIGNPRKRLHKLRRTGKVFKVLKPLHKYQDSEPLKLGQRVILRSGGPVPVQQLVRLHAMYQKYEARANEILETTMRGEPTRESNTALHCVVRELFEE